MKTFLLWASVSLGFLVQPRPAWAHEMVRIPAGEFTPFYQAAGPAAATIRVAAFELDVRPVTNADFLAFVRANPSWRRSAVRRVHADDKYLAHWSGDLEPGDRAVLDAPVVNLSWFAARAYAAWVGKRLPTLAEWEYAAAAEGVDGRSPADVVLAWYSRPAGAGSSATSPAPFLNTLGVEAMHGAVWEWVDDFNSAIVSADSRSREAIDRGQFCGAGSLNAADRNDYATFMRYAYRNSLKGRYTGRLLGFRCARDVAPPADTSASNRG